MAGSAPPPRAGCAPDHGRSPMPTEAKRETVAALKEELSAQHDAHRLGVPRPQGERDRRDPAVAAQAGRVVPGRQEPAHADRRERVGQRRPVAAARGPDRDRVRDRRRGDDRQGGPRRDPAVQDRQGQGRHPRRPRDRRRRRHPARDAPVAGRPPGPDRRGDRRSDGRPGRPVRRSAPRHRRAASARSPTSAPPSS